MAAIEASIRALSTTSTGYAVEVRVATDGSAFTLTVDTGCEDGQAAVECAREWVRQIGPQFAQAFREPGSLKTKDGWSI